MINTETIKKLRYILSSHKSYLDEYISTGDTGARIDKKIEEFFFNMDFCIKQIKQGKGKKLLVEQVLMNHISFLETVMTQKDEIEELEGFKSICSCFYT